MDWQSSQTPSSRGRAPTVPQLPPALPRDAHKGLAGRVLCLCGSRDMPGAAILVARAAQRAGAGLVSVACTSESLRFALPIAAPEAILVDLARPEDLTMLLADLRADACVLGPGLSTSALARALVEAWLVACPVTSVLDADALNILGADLDRLHHAGPALVLTPHPGEAARLLGRAVPNTRADREAAAREISARSGAVCVLKGADTLIVEGERLHVNDTGGPALATAGSGDVLAGILGAYLATCATLPTPGWDAFAAACAAVRVHGRAGDLAAQALGERAVIASDLITYLGAADQSLR